MRTVFSLNSKVVSLCWYGVLMYELRHKLHVHSLRSRGISEGLYTGNILLPEPNDPGEKDLIKTPRWKYLWWKKCILTLFDTGNGIKEKGLQSSRALHPQQKWSVPTERRGSMSNLSQRPIESRKPSVDFPAGIKQSCHWDMKEYELPTNITASSFSSSVNLPQ